MPIEYLLLRDCPVPIERCPYCGAHPFRPFLRGLVQRSRRSWWGLGRPRPYCALICSECQIIVGHERPQYP